MTDIKLNNTGRVVLADKLIEVYLTDTVPTYNFTSVDNSLEATALSGTFLTTTFTSSGIDIVNRNIGAVLEYNTLTSGINILSTVQFETNLKRTITVSGSKLGGRL